jgi:hypothetical protein
MHIPIPLVDALLGYRGLLLILLLIVIIVVK